VKVVCAQNMDQNLLLLDDDLGYMAVEMLGCLSDCAWIHVHVLLS
jgi:hypothetical protein